MSALAPLAVIAAFAAVGLWCTTIAVTNLLLRLGTRMRGLSPVGPVTAAQERRGAVRVPNGRPPPPGPPRGMLVLHPRPGTRAASIQAHTYRSRYDDDGPTDMVGGFGDAPDSLAGLGRVAELQEPFKYDLMGDPAGVLGGVGPRARGLPGFGRVAEWQEWRERLVWLSTR